MDVGEKVLPFTMYDIVTVLQRDCKEEKKMTPGQIPWIAFTFYFQSCYTLDVCKSWELSEGVC